MKVCWDMLEGARLAKSGTFRKNGISYVYKESCAKCGEPYLTEKGRQSKFCSIPCAASGKKYTESTKRLLSKLNSGKNNSMYGETHTIEARRKMVKNGPNHAGSAHPSWKGELLKLV